MATTWGELTIPRDGESRVEIGTLALTVARRDRVWVLGWSDAPEERIPSAAAADDASDAASKLQIRPALPDRALICRRFAGLAGAEGGQPADLSAGATLRLLPGAHLDLFQAVPLWLQIVQADGALLCDRPIERPSDTFFGSTTRQGELAYAASEAAALDARSHHGRSDVALAQIQLRNLSARDWSIQRLYLPAPSLSLYVEGHDREPDEEAASCPFRTSSLAIERADNHARADVRVDKTPPPALRSPRVAAEPRHRATPNLLVRAFSEILG
jgi:hypothetical protein